jgi:hypothetical protein
MVPTPKAILRARPDERLSNRQHFARNVSVSISGLGNGPLVIGHTDNGRAISCSTSPPRVGSSYSEEVGGRFAAWQNLSMD